MNLEIKDRIKNIKFSRELNGYSVPEVNEFLNNIYDYILELEKNNDILNDEIRKTISRHQNEITELQNENILLKNSKRYAEK
ncbi:MAG0865 family DivIVA-related protein [Mycoplasma tauri]|uniref:DivIVA domain-containing protein n=1 Tax=Mycoplasma tauri TaxID=547987 RepID=A0A953NCU7_9MOLU|nr:DivIVA domain-containing protein [Mycoplasma tauri]MBZ4195516.1 DivIVA domain-containing protein [Mycoplasma tauri]MBZ4203742.1 DivIVA domain-containing protein [Mycoplasma tauri]MBZ4204317.1 DivIVA domain-containing protein [Mycoplasma tauri]MBZ4212844.1 DivIVA domain-containing protein [Mycoplasma tauri]MBZ4218371.1 DivIVA domain-containing protein [Mycoplasma tauri]